MYGTPHLPTLYTNVYTQDAIREWFKMYKTADGKPENSFAFDGAAKDKAFALQIVEETNQSYLNLLAGKLANPKGLNLDKKL